MSIFRHNPKEILVDKLDIDRSEPGPFIFDPEKEISERDWDRIIGRIEGILAHQPTEFLRSTYRNEHTALIAMISPKTFQRKTEGIFDRNGIRKNLEEKYSATEENIEELMGDWDIYRDQMLEGEYSNLLEIGYVAKAIFPEKPIKLSEHEEDEIAAWLVDEIKKWPTESNMEEMVGEFTAHAIIYSSGRWEDLRENQILWNKAHGVLEAIKSRGEDNESYIRLAGWFRIISPESFSKRINIDENIVHEVREKLKRDYLMSLHEIDEVYKTQDMLKTLLALTILSAEKVWIDETGLHYELPKNRPTVAPTPPLPEPLKF